MNLDVTLNTNDDVDISYFDEHVYRFIITLQSIPSMTGLWELFLKLVLQIYPEALEEAQLAYKTGDFTRALSAKPVPGGTGGNGSGNKNKIISQELDVTGYPLVETGDTGDNEIGYQCTDQEIILSKRTEMYVVQVKLIFSLAFAPGENKLTYLSRIFLNQVALLLRIETLEFHSVKDDLTSAYNQKYLRGFIQNEIERCNRYPSFFSVVFFDLDNLKSINDTYGHLIGTEVLKEVAYILRHQVRKIDLLSRFGGDEFVVVLLKANPQKAYETCCRIRQQLESTIFLKDKNLNIKMTGCFGISGFPRDGSTVDELIKKADFAMYEVKRTGKNDIKIYEGA